MLKEIIIYGLVAGATTLGTGGVAQADDSFAHTCDQVKQLAPGGNKGQELNALISVCQAAGLHK